MAVPWPWDKPNGPAHGLTDEEVTRHRIESRARQGLPPNIEDPYVIDLIVASIRAPFGGDDGCPAPPAATGR